MKELARLRLTINEAKTAVASAFGRKFLGFCFWVALSGVVKCGTAGKALLVFKHRALLALGARPELAQRVAANSRRWSRNRRYELNRLMPIAYFDRLGVLRLS